MPYKYRDLMWSEMTDRQKELAGSKSDHKAAKAAYEARQSSDWGDGNTLTGPINNPETPTAGQSPAAPSQTSDWGDGNTLTGPINNPETPTAGKPPAANEAKERAENYKYRDLQWSEMTDRQKTLAGSKEDHKDARRDAGTYTNDRLESYNVDSLDDFDITFTGKGRKEGENRLSVTELERMAAAGHSKEEIARRAAEGGEWSDAMRGGKAQRLLDSWMAEFTEDTPPGGGGEDTSPGGGGEDTSPGGGGEDTQPGGGGGGGSGGGSGGGGGTGGGGGGGTGGGGGSNTGTGGGGNDVIDVIGDDNNVIGDNGIINEDIGNTEITESFNGGTIGDITQGGTINGNNNTINNTVDNRNQSRYYGGDVNTMSINYGDSVAGSPSGTWAIPTAPMSDLTMLGYGKPSDSPASNASFVDFYQTLNKDSQDQYDNFGSQTAAKFIANARSNNSMQSTLDLIQRQLYGYRTVNDQGQTITVPGTAQRFINNSLDRQVLTFGEMDKFPTFKWNNPEPLEPVDTDLEDAQNDAMNNL